MLNVADPRSKYPPRIDDPSISRSSTIDSGSTGRPRNPAVQNSAPRSVFADSRIGSGEPSARSARGPATARRGKKRSPLLISCTTPNHVSPSVASSRGGTIAIDTQQD